MQLCRRKYKKIKRKELTDKEETKFIKRKVDEKFVNNYFTTSAYQYFKSVAKYWEDGSFSKFFTDKKQKTIGGTLSIDSED